MGRSNNHIPGCHKMLDEKWEAGKVKNKAARFTLIDGVLYWQGYSALLLRCISPQRSTIYLGEVT